MEGLVSSDRLGQSDKMALALMEFWLGKQTVNKPSKITRKPLVQSGNRRRRWEVTGQSEEASLRR